MLQGNPLVGGKGLNRPIAAEPPDAGVLLAAKWIVRQVVHRLIINMRHTGLDAYRKPHTPFAVAGKNRAGKSVVGGIRDAEGVFIAACTDNGRDRPEQLFAGEQVIVADITKDVGRQDQVFGLAAQHFPRPRFTCLANALPQAVQLFSIDDGTDYGIGLSWVYLFQLPSPIRETLHERLINP
ncbi:MAG: hypothetical protein JWO48_587, partial [Bryobacterales bacterium]|nr:hypothetical protein [Bryobacterales bacterium]